jgi:hypothetical protein
MTPGEAVLRKVVEWKPEGADRPALFVPAEGSGWAVQLTVERNDEWGCAAWELSLRRTDMPSDAGVEALRTWAANVAGRVTGLMDPLKLVEVDAERREALVRSAHPRKRGSGLYYYEIFFKGLAEAVVRRYQGFAEGKPRAQAAFPLTHEALARVINELAGVH